MRPSPAQLLQLLRDNPSINAAHTDTLHGAPIITVWLNSEANPQTPLALRAIGDTPIIRRQTPTIRPLTCPPDLAPADTSHTACQDEPIRLGTQLQPAGANWVGTAGLPVRWRDTPQHDHWGILSNWHVMVPTGAQAGHNQHQPTVARPACANLSRWQAVSPDHTNHADCAAADALIDGYHTISTDILDVGTPGHPCVDAQVGLDVIKSGRTTALTYGYCQAVGAAVRVDYGEFTALFEDQDVFASDAPPFSQPGDSGSAIITQTGRHPCSLLFAGNDILTVANPIRYVIQALALEFPFVP